MTANDPPLLWKILETLVQHTMLMRRSIVARNGHLLDLQDLVDVDDGQQDGAGKQEENVANEFVAVASLSLLLFQSFGW